MSAAKHTSVPSNVSLRFVGLCGLVAGAIIGAALILRGPDIAVLPVTEGREIVLPNGQSLFVQPHEVTIAEWNLCAAQQGCSLEVRARPDQEPEKTPATGLSYVDVQEYITWINARTGHDFRLPFIAEWDFMAASVLPDQPDPLFTDPALTWASAYLIEGITRARSNLREAFPSLRKALPIWMGAFGSGHKIAMRKQTTLIGAQPSMWVASTSQQCLTSFETQHEEAVPSEIRLRILACGSFQMKAVDAIFIQLRIVHLPRWLVNDALETNALEAVLPKWTLEGSVTPIQALYGHRHHIPSKVEVFVDFLKETLANRSWN